MASIARRSHPGGHPAQFRPRREKPVARGRPDVVERAIDRTRDVSATRRGHQQASDPGVVGVGGPIQGVDGGMHPDDMGTARTRSRGVEHVLSSFRAGGGSECVHRGREQQPRSRGERGGIGDPISQRIQHQRRHQDHPPLFATRGGSVDGVGFMVDRARRRGVPGDSQWR